MKRDAAGRGLILLSLLLMCTAPAAAQGLPAPFSADYEGARFPFTAKATITLSRIGDYYRYTLHGAVYAVLYKWTEIYDCSILRVRGDTFYPLEYVHRDRRNGRHDIHTVFDWAHHVVRTTRADGKAHKTEQLPATAWDPMSIQVRLRADAAAARRGTQRSYALVEKGEVKQHQVRFDGVERLHSDQGVLAVVKAEVAGGRHDDAFWFAKNYAWLPVRVNIGAVQLDLASPPATAARPASPPGDAPPRCG